MADFFLRHIAKKEWMRFVGNLQTFSFVKIFSNIRLTFIIYLYSMLLTADCAAVLIKGHALFCFLTGNRMKLWLLRRKAVSIYHSF